MAEARPISRWRLELEVLSPLHVGAGGPPLVHEYDYAAGREKVWVLDLDRVLDHVPEERLLGQIDAPPARLVPREVLPDCVRYEMLLRGGEKPEEIIPCVRDAADRPYLPGSSLKGALRTALAWSLAGQESGAALAQEAAPNPKYAAAPIERRLFGPNPNQDLLRALRVADASPHAAAEAEVSVAAVYSLRGTRLEPKGAGHRWWVETLPTGARLSADVSLEEYLFGPRAQALSFNQRRAVLAELPRRAAAFAAALAAHEARFYAAAGQPALAAFARQLQQRAEQAAPDEGLLQIGWGAGWTAKTLGLLLEADPRFPDLVRRYSLDRGRGSSVFPKTRRLVERGNTPEAPLGWTHFRLLPR